MSGLVSKKSLSVTMIVLVMMTLDQLSKWWVVERFIGYEDSKPFGSWLLSVGQEMRPFDSEPITSFFNLVVVWNRGISFGLFAGSASWMTWILSILSTIVTGFFIWLLTQTQNKVAITGIALIIAGALSNIWDRMRFGAVSDFLDFHYAGWHYPAFNVADSCIVIGVILYFIVGLMSAEEE